MTREEFSNNFDLHYNNVTSNQAPGLTEWEKSVFLTKGQDEIVKDYFTANSKGNNIGQGFDDSAKRQADFSCLMKVLNCGASEAAGNYKIICINSDFTVREYGEDHFIFSPGTPAKGQYTITNNTTLTGTGGPYTVSPAMPYAQGTLIKSEVESSVVKIDSRSTVYDYPDDVFISINEVVQTNAGGILQVVPLRYDEYLRLMSKPYKRPLKNQAWRLINTGTGATTKTVEIIAGPGAALSSYTIRYVRRPKPIIVGDLDGLTINGYYLDGTTVPVNPAIATNGECELDPILHEDILQRAVELAKIAWTATGQDNAQMMMAAGQRSE